MLNFKIDFIDKAKRCLKKIPQKEVVKILHKINNLRKNPFPSGNNPKKLKGGSNYRLRAGNYRILYNISKNIIKIYSICHRKDAYKN